MKAYAVDNAPAPTNTIAGYSASSFTTATSTPWVLGTTAWSNNVLQTLPNASNVVQEIINRPGWTAGNSLMLRMIWDNSGGVSKTAQHYRFLYQYENGSSTAPTLDLSFTNFYNTVRFPSVNRTFYGPLATAWDELIVTDDLSSCGTCYIEYRVHNAATDAVLAGPFTRSAGSSGTSAFDISTVSISNIYVSTRVYRNSSPVIHDLWLTTNDVSPLPVEMGRITTSCYEEGVELNWSTLSESNSSHFEVYKSENLESWEYVDKLSAQGNSSTQTDYVVFDSKTKRGIMYYKIMQYDFNGKKSEFGPVFVNCEVNNYEMIIVPNPSSKYVTIDSPNNDVIKVMLIDLTGKVIYQNDQIMQTSCTFDIREFADGIYTVLVKTRKGIETKKLIISK